MLIIHIICVWRKGRVPVDCNNIFGVPIYITKRLKTTAVDERSLSYRFAQVDCNNIFEVPIYITKRLKTTAVDERSLSYRFAQNCH